MILYQKSVIGYSYSTVKGKISMNGVSPYDGMNT